MKKIWKIRRDSEAVSPVIATILMVAITVVLASVLYVMVMGFGGPTTQTPTGSFSSVEKVSTTEKVRFGVITPETTWTEIKIVVENVTAGQSDTWTFPTSGTSLTPPASQNIDWISGISYADLAGDGKISSGDYLTITFSSQGGSAPYEFKVSMVYIATGAVIDDISFTWQ
ncbi:MAG: type IV pilin N-terminal domain-containing protein [Methanomassiliicoccales archaeon]|jgi:flagellin-like protein|nr:type IV pilin N-terminal domain-containing protein [Methanomassiliicoccales archaeon]